MQSKTNEYQNISKSNSNENNITYVTLDESILDIDSWLPKHAIQEVVDLIKKCEEMESESEELIYDKHFQ